MKRGATIAVLVGLVFGGHLMAQQEDRPSSLETESPPPVASSPQGSAATESNRETSEPGEMFVGANAAYERGDHKTAIRLYIRLLEDGLESGRLHYNLGNAYLRNGELGRAIASYRASRLLLPRDEDVRANLAFARKSAKDAISPPEPPAVLATLFFWHYGLSPTELTATVLVVNLLLWGVWMARLFHRDSELLRWLFILLLVILVATGGSLLRHRVFPSPVAVILPQEVGAHTAPDPDAVVRFKLHAGTEVRVREQREEWLRIRLTDGQQGWIETAWAEVVER